MLRRPHYIAAGLVALLTLLVLNLPGHTTARLKLALGSLFLPLFGLASGTQQAAGHAGNALLSKGELLRLHETLHRENQLLRLQAAQADELGRENARLRELLERRGQTKRQYKLANVVLRDPANWWRTVQIDLGSRHGVSNNLPVLSAEGFLVGRIAQTGPTLAQVLLLGDPNCRVAALVENESREAGVIGAGGPFDSSLVEMKCYLSRTTNLKPGQRVVTSGDGGLFPKGILIGTITDARPVESGLYTMAQVKLAANLARLEEVWVLFP